MIGFGVVSEHFVTNRVFFDEACKWCCIQNEQFRAKHRALRNTEVWKSHRSPGMFLLIGGRL